MSTTVDTSCCSSADTATLSYLATTQAPQMIETGRTPAAVALLDLPASGTLVPAVHSWLVPVERITGLSGPQTKLLLSIRAEPPYLVMVLPAAAMREARVEVREPRGVDAVPKRHDQWSPGDVPGERIDQDIPFQALGGLRWRP